MAAAWGLAAITAFIPVAHVVLVPGFLLLGLVLGARRLTIAEAPVGGSGTCPDCGTAQALDLAGKWELPFGVTCGSCQRRLTLRTPD